METQGDSEIKVWAAAEIFRLDPSVTSARTYVDDFYPSGWAGRFFNVMRYDTHAALTYVSTAGATAAVVANMSENIGDQVDYIFDERRSLPQRHAVLVLLLGLELDSSRLRCSFS